jgi:hypothetical protein
MEGSAADRRLITASDQLFATANSGTPSMPNVLET